MRTSITCPRTDAIVSIDVRDDRRSVLKEWDRSFKVRCPHCGETHIARYRDMYIKGVLAGFQGEFDGLPGARAKP
jgi:hypothetical protein